MEIKHNKTKQCEICKENATNLCLKCMIYLCDNCFKFIHDKNANSGHEKEKIDYFVPIDTKCPEHPKYLMDFFCIDEKGNILF